MVHGRRMKLFSARTAGLLYLIVLAFGLASEAALRTRIFVPDDAAATAANAAEAQWLLRAVLAANLTYLAGEVVMTAILYLLFRRVSEPVSLLAAALRLVSLAVFTANLSNLLAARTDPTNALRHLEAHQHGYAAGLVIFGLNCLAMGHLLRHSGRTALGVLLGVAGVGYLVNSYLFTLVPGYGGEATPVLLAPALIAETWFCVVLLRARSPRL
ncbi:hypothetical protein Pa4123_48840 [Phytohabitans aurantiacus]|uniref:DUF4386 domain-containing protein n=2 Tax=Phytohabitans aurantiacus TaxID=3016789 RepID=A0ABQ5QYH6_9ACTN|nr:hypothetical protein Pa4123_48840 [Phytohabitans aurantiacus]